MSNFLYVGALGRTNRLHSFSGGSTFDKCPRKYELGRIKGWKEKSKNAAREFGTCVEAAIQFWHSPEMSMQAGGASAKFIEFWAEHQKRTDLSYSKKEGDWNDMLQMGTEMLQLYEVKFPSFGFLNPEFQLNYRKVVCPDDPEMNEIEFTAYIDILADTVAGEQIIIDIKTGSSQMPDDPKRLKLDPQLRSYAWITGVPLVGFLAFTKYRPEGYKKGDAVTLLVNKAKMQAGDPAVVLSVTEDGDEVQAAAVLSPKKYAEYEEGAKGLKGNALKAFKENFGRDHGTGIHLSDLTRQRLQFITVRVPEESSQEQGRTIADQIQRIQKCYDTGYWPQRPGIRWPDNWCDMCEMQPICYDDPEERDKTLVQIALNTEPSSPVTRPEEDEADWLED